MHLLNKNNLQAKIYSSTDLIHGEILDESNWPKDVDEDLIWILEISISDS